LKFDTLDDLVSGSARRWPDRTALLDENGRRLSYQNLEAWVNAFSHRLAKLGAESGARVAILSRNSFESVAAYFALLKAGAVVVWLNQTLGAKDLGLVCKDAEISVLLCEEEFKGRAEKISEACGVKIEALNKFKNTPEENRNFKSFSRPEGLAAIVYTSGSTDKPLGVMLTHRNLLSNNEAIAAYLNLNENDRVCCVLPFYYIYGLSLLLSHVAAGGSVFMENRFSYPQAALEAMETQKVTGFSGVSSHFILLMNHTDFLSRKLPALRYFTHAGDKMPVAVTEKILKAFPRKPLFLMYGQTEAAPRISYLDPSLAGKKPASAGKALKNIEMKILKDNEAPCAVGEEGEIVIRGENVMKGYWNNPKETQKVLRKGWLFTGDTGYLDADGDLFVTGRLKQFIKVGGRRVSPAEVESLALGYPGVREAAVVGIPDETLGEKLRLYATEDVTQPVNTAALADFYKKKAPFYKVPAEIVIVAALPRNGQGKIDRKRLAGMKG